MQTRMWGLLPPHLPPSPSLPFILKGQVHEIVLYRNEPFLQTRIWGLLSSYLPPSHPSLPFILRDNCSWDCSLQNWAIPADQSERIWGLFPPHLPPSHSLPFILKGQALEIVIQWYELFPDKNVMIIFATSATYPLTTFYIKETSARDSSSLHWAFPTDPYLGPLPSPSYHLTRDFFSIKEISSQDFLLNLEITS